MNSQLAERIHQHLSLIHIFSPESLAVTVGGINISAFCDKSVTEALEFIQALELTDREKMIAAPILKEIKSRLGFLQSVGLEYLCLLYTSGGAAI